MFDFFAVSIAQIRPGDGEYLAALALRDTILRRPLGLSFTAEEMAKEEGCIHLVGVIGAEVVATLLLQPLDPATVQMRQVAVRADLQGQGIGRRLLLAAEAAAREQGFTRLMAHARETALAFYERNGYAPEGDIFTEATILHRAVTKILC